MTDALDVLYDEIEKAKGLIPKGGSARLSAKFKNQSRKLARGARADMAAFDNSHSRLTNSNQKRLDRGYKRAGRAGDLSAARAYLTRRQVRKSDTDSLDRLYDAVEKARGLIPRGGSSKLARRMDKRFKSGEPGLRTAHARNYLGTRKKYGKVAAGSGGKRYAGYYESRQGKYT